MAIVTLEDLQGSIEVVVFPRLYETTRPTWRDGAILLIAGRVDHKGEEVSLLADLVVDWDEAAARGPEAFARDVAAGDRGRGGGAGRTARCGRDRDAPARGAAGPGRRRYRWRAEPPAGAFVVPAAGPTPAGTPAAGTPPASLPPIQPAGAGPDLRRAAGAAVATADERRRAAVPDEARARIVGDVDADAPLAAGPETVLHVRFAGRRRPGPAGHARWRPLSRCSATGPAATRVVIHVPAPGGGTALPMELRRGVAYDAELLAEVRRRLGEGLVDLRLAST